MRFDYEYRTSGNERRRGSLSAADRETAFAALKAQGIRPSRVTESPGVFNKLFGKGKRWLVIVLLAMTLAVVLLLVNRNAGLEILVKPVNVGRSAIRSIDVLTNDPVSKAELERFLSERKAAEHEYRERFIRRVKAGTLSKDEANRIFKAMGMEELPPN